ncbi:MAG TPA: hypothetical protein PJ986_02745 [Gammaproteobacteria bacterium]|nr:hypothetical protein [Gammaproteobacteria bacterium]
MNVQRARLPLIALAALTIAACASGSSIVTGVTRAPIASAQVQLYLEPPAEFEVIGLISASSDAGLTEQASVDFASEELKKQAAKLGANGVLVVSTDNTKIDVFGGYAKTVQGKAIFVKAQ